VDRGGDLRPRAGGGDPDDLSGTSPGAVPGGPWFFRRHAADRPSRGLAILEAVAAGRPLRKRYQMEAVEAQRRAQDFWWEHGFLAP
jgi:hypothetical protein